MSDILNKYVENIKTTLGGNLKSIILYGSKASDEDIKKHSDHNLLIIMDSISFKDLENIKKISRIWIKKGEPPPLLFTSTGFKNSSDVFPIEFLDMKRKHKILYGENPFTELEIRTNNLRHQCEFELKSKLIKLRQMYIYEGDNQKKVRDILVQSISSFLIIFNHILRLLGEEPPLKNIDGLKKLSEKINIDISVFMLILKIKEGDKEAKKINPQELMEKYLFEIEKIVEFVDNL